MDLGTDSCYAGVLLALLRSLTQLLDGCLERCSCLLSCLLAGFLLNEGARGSLLLAVPSEQRGERLTTPGRR